MTTFFWSAGHFGWLFFGIVVFSILCLLAADVAWRLVSMSSRKLLAITALVWAAGVTALVLILNV
ncbi:hypothetical protein PY254_01425 [Rhodanobacter sp. AS-Z3]|uniref:hypothetical protein n=1 Tax=Rhodanobacter sp. AS-Z3 TaxID=3031330 RepID=UPI0024794571|nr:hypothetical protein [Rhodanobacter sp. AS-Z3]WEN15369.1 hypothetical protein PY254_01425 [Rhodanobacter sp. AS-Z3]